MIFRREQTKYSVCKIENSVFDVRVCRGAKWAELFCCCKEMCCTVIYVLALMLTNKPVIDYLMYKRLT